MAITKPDLTRVWAAGAASGDIEDPDITVPGKFDAGWQAEIPPFENFNFIQQLFTQGLAYLNEQGMMVYDNITDYPVKGMSKGSDGNIYSCLIANGPDSSIVDPVGDTTGTWLKIVSLEELKTTSLTHEMTADADYILTTTENYNGRIIITDIVVDLTAARNIIVSDVERMFFGQNETAEDLVFKTSTGTGITVVPGGAILLLCDGTDVIEPFPVATIPDASTTQKGIVELATSAETITGTDTVRAITPAGLQATTALTSRKGIAELATNNETIAGTDAFRVVTPVSLQSKVAGETAKGIAELATQAETDAGSDDLRIVTPLKLSNSPQVVKAWVNFDSTATPVINGSFNVSSITDTAIGDYTINFSTSLADVNYTVSSFVAGFLSAQTALVQAFGQVVYTVSGCRVQTTQASATPTETTINGFTFFGN